MVTKKELSDFKQTLTTALQNAGYTAFGRIPSSEDIFNFYAHLPEQEMAETYAEDNNLDEINRVYRVIKHINENSDSFYSLVKVCKEHDVDYPLFAHAIENLPYMKKTGEKRKTQYHWIHDEPPSFKSAKDIVDHMRQLKANKLNKSLKKKIKRAVSEGISKEDFFRTTPIRKGSTYSADIYYNNQRMQQKKATIEEVPDAVAEEAPQLESQPVVPEQEHQEQQEQQEQISTNGVSVITNEEELPEPQLSDDASLETEIYILRQEIKYLKSINKAKDKLIEALRRKYLN